MGGRSGIVRECHRGVSTIGENWVIGSRLRNGFVVRILIKDESRGFFESYEYVNGAKCGL